MSLVGTTDSTSYYRVPRGNIYLCEYQFEGAGLQPAKERPVIVVSQKNNGNGTVTVVPLTTQPKDASPTHVIVTLSTGVSSVALCECATTISKSKLGKYQETLDRSYLPGINKALAMHFGLTGISLSQALSTDEILKKAEFTLKVAEFMNTAAFPMSDIRQTLKGALDMACGERILKEPLMASLPENNEKPISESKSEKIEEPKAPITPEVSATSETALSPEAQVTLETSAEIATTDSELVADNEQESYFAESDELSLSSASEEISSKEEAALDELAMQPSMSDTSGEVAPSMSAKIDGRATANSFCHSSDAIRQKLGLVEGEYLMAEIAKSLDKSIDSIWRVVVKYNLKIPEYARKVGDKYAYNEKAVDIIKRHFLNKGQK